MQLNDSCANSVASCCMTAGAMQASVAIKPSMVAILGRIMPAPLLMPVMQTVAPPISTCLLKALGTVSVVMMACAALNQLSALASAMAASKPAMMRSLGKVSMMTPVEKGNTCCALMPIFCAKALQVLWARFKPSSPVPALALPVLITMARIPVAEVLV